MELPSWVSISDEYFKARPQDCTALAWFKHISSRIPLEEILCVNATAWYGRYGNASRRFGITPDTQKQPRKVSNNKKGWAQRSALREGTSSDSSAPLSGFDHPWSVPLVSMSFESPENFVSSALDMEAVRRWASHNSFALVFYGILCAWLIPYC